MTMVNLLNNNRSTIVVPTDDDLVRKQLRDLDEPACYFGEGPAERRDRLAKLLTNLTPEARTKLQSAYETKAIVNNNKSGQTFYYEGSEDLIRARYTIACFSMKQANCRLDLARLKQLVPETTRLVPRQELVEQIRRVEDLGTYVDEDSSTNELKMLTSCNFNPNGDLLATSCRSGKCKIWSIPDMETSLLLRGHETNANFITFSPKSGSDDLPPTAANLASCAMSGSISLWNLVNDQPICNLSGPQNDWRVSRVRYHPSGLFLASCCSDNSWRLWDLSSEKEILHQEGHADFVFDLGFHPDGSLTGSAGMDSYARIWDLRTGRSLKLLEGHTSGIRTIDFSPDGYRVATGSMDNSVKIWNLRQMKLEYTIPAHLGAVTTVMFEKENGYYLATSSFDKTVKFWSCPTWAPIKELNAYEDKITKLDLTMRSNYFATCHYKYLKLWSASTTANFSE